MRNVLERPVHRERRSATNLLRRLDWHGPARSDPKGGESRAPAQPESDEAERGKASRGRRAPSPSLRDHMYGLALRHNHFPPFL